MVSGRPQLFFLLTPSVLVGFRLKLACAAASAGKYARRAGRCAGWCVRRCAKKRNEVMKGEFLKRRALQKKRAVMTKFALSFCQFAVPTIFHVPKLKDYLNFLCFYVSLSLPLSVSAYFSISECLSISSFKHASPSGKF